MTTWNIVHESYKPILLYFYGAHRSLYYWKCISFVCSREESTASPADLKWHKSKIRVKYVIFILGWTIYLITAIVSLNKMAIIYFSQQSSKDSSSSTRLILDFNSYWFTRCVIFDPSLPYLWQITYGVRSASMQANVMLYWFLCSVLYRGADSRE